MNLEIKDEKEENKLLICPIFKSYSKFRKMGYKKIISNSIFEYGIKIKNINNLIFDGEAKIKNIEIRQLNGSVLTTDKEFKIPQLNPDEIKIIWFEKTCPSFSGEVWFAFNIENKKNIQTYQWDKVNKSPAKFIKKNYWGDIFVIKDESIFQQEITNILLVILTSVLVISEIASRIFN